VFKFTTVPGPSEQEFCNSNEKDKHVKEDGANDVMRCKKPGLVCPAKSFGYCIDAAFEDPSMSSAQGLTDDDPIIQQPRPHLQETLACSFIAKAILDRDAQ